MEIQAQKLSYNDQLKATLILSFAFMFMFTSYTTTETVVTKFYESNGHQYYGRISLIIIYAAFALSTTYSSSIVPALGYKAVFIIGALFYGILDASALIIYFTNSQFIALFTIVVSSILCGVAAGNIWVAQNAYIGKIASKQNVNQMFGLSEGIRSISQIIGYLLTVYMFKYYDGYTFFNVLIPISILSVVLLFFLPSPPDDNSYKRINNADNVGLEKMKNYFKLFGIKQNYEIYIYETLNSFPAALLSNFVYKIVDSFFAAQPGESISAYNSRLTYLFGIAMLSFGVSRSIISFYTKTITDHLNCFQFCYYSSILGVISIVVGAISYYLSSFWICCLFSFLLGILYAATRNSSNILIKQVLKNDLDLIGINYFLTAIGFIANIILIFILTKISISLCLAAYFFIFLYIASCTAKIQEVKGNSHFANPIQMQKVHT